MKEIWICMEGNNYEFFDSEETARLAYKKWCRINGADFSETIFQRCYLPISKCITIWTKDNLDEYIPS